LSVSRRATRMPARGDPCSFICASLIFFDRLCDYL
jgi:hypothetical protein